MGRHRRSTGLHQRFHGAVRMPKPEMWNRSWSDNPELMTFSRSSMRPGALFGNRQRTIAGWYASFEHGRCRIDVARVPAPLSGSNVAAAMYWCDLAGAGLRPILFED